ncbi:MAG: MFS transporter [Alphaproteobacteria bacterium]|nr:MFS transporter [Alphaproteobacteria bacterium]
MATGTDIELGSGGAAGRQTRTLIGVASAHWLSHVHIMVLPPLFPVLNSELGLSYIQLGFAITLFGLVSGLTQAPMGVLVDRFGARGILVAGLCLGGAAFIAIGLMPTYPVLLIGATIAGLANSVYHPADYALLSAGMDDRRMGRAFSIHTFAGFVGGALAPVMMALIAAKAGVGTALIVAGALGPLVALFLLILGLPDSRAEPEPRTDGTIAKKSTFLEVCSAPILMLMLFFVLLGLSTGGINGFGVAALIKEYGVNYQTASLALTLFLGFASAGVLAGGVLADKTERHGNVAAACFAINAIIVFAIAFMTPPVVVLMAMLSAAGFLSGLIAPSRDMLVRKAAPQGAAGRAFGIVSTGFNIGSIIGPMIYGYIMDLDLPRVVFMVSACFMLTTVILALATERREAAKR